VTKGKLEKAFGLALKELRMERGLSQEKLALESKHHRTYIGMLERGLQNPTLRTIVRLAETLEVPAAEIVARFEKQMR
jgi:transcriptional regulator with XRE-family HTH domain